ncbi:MAG: ubiquinone biosynthesis hydroxylase [Hyphomicrobiales bacterium]
MSADESNTTGERYDIVVAGGNYVGLALALSIRDADPACRIAVVDARPVAVADRDPRASAIASAAASMLGQLGVWHEIEPEAQPILDMVITDSRTSDVARPVFLTFAGEVEPGQPFAYMVPNAVMVKSLRDRAIAAGVDFLAPETVTGFDIGADDVTITLGSGHTLSSALLVAADGVRSKLRDLAGIRTVGWDYGQSGIVVTVAHERPHNGRAEEHFLPAGPFAILPLTGNRSSLVWTEPHDRARRLVEGDDLTFRLELERRFGHHLGTLEATGPRHAFPLRLQIARSFVKSRFALAGDAAHGIHPIAGQGLNMGFRDVAALAEVIVDARRIGLDPGSLAVLERYERWRRFDTVQMGAVTDVINRLFSNDNDFLRIVRDVGLGLVDRVPALKRFFIEEAAGINGDLPRLLRGEAL